MGGDEAEADGFGGSKVEADNEAWPDFHPTDMYPSPGTPDLRRNPEGWGQFLSFPCRSSLTDTRVSTPRMKTYPWGPRDASLLASRTEKNWLPGAARGKVNNRV